MLLRRIQYTKCIIFFRSGLENMGALQITEIGTSPFPPSVNMTEEWPGQICVSGSNLSKWLSNLVHRVTAPFSFFGSHFGFVFFPSHCGWGEVPEVLSLCKCTVCTLVKAGRHIFILVDYQQLAFLFVKHQIPLV